MFFRLWAWSGNRGALVATAIAENFRTLVFVVGLLLVARGLALVSTPAAFIVPGAILIWLAIPPAARMRKTP